MCICRAVLFDSVYWGGDSCCVCVFCMAAVEYMVKMNEQKMRKLEKQMQPQCISKKRGKKGGDLCVLVDI